MPEGVVVYRRAEPAAVRRGPGLSVPARRLAIMCVLFALGASAGAQSAEEAEPLVETDVRWLDPLPRFGLRFRGLTARVGGRVVFDGTQYGPYTRRVDRIRSSDVRLRLTGDVGPLTGLIESDLLGLRTPRNLYEAWAAWEVHPALRVAAGQFRVGLGSEYATEPRDLAFEGYSFTSYLDGRHDVGVRVDGSILDDNLYYEATATLGKGFGLEGRRRDGPMYSLRVLGRPFGFIAEDGEGWTSFLRGAYVGAAYAQLEDFDDPIILATPYESVVVRTPDLDARGGWWRHLEAGYHHGPVRMSWELVGGEIEDVLVGPRRREDIDRVGSWQATLAWNLTGEEQMLHRGRWRAGARDKGLALIPPGAIPGRVEAAVRYSNADIDRALWDAGITNYAVSTQEVRTFSGTLSWSPIEDPEAGRLRFSLGFERTLADHEIASLGFTNRDTSYRFRIELDF